MPSMCAVFQESKRFRTLILQLKTINEEEIERSRGGDNEEIENKTPNQPANENKKPQERKRKWTFEFSALTLNANSLFDS